MSIKVPKYFTRFRCIAEKCRDNCCIGWEIRIDDELMEKYKNLKGDLGPRLARGIESDGESHTFRLTQAGRCPFLNDMGLCDIISEVGEGYLCEICREHPRYYNVFTGYCEGGIGMACEVGALLVINSDDDDFTE
jgi:lysine-N-methylase